MNYNSPQTGAFCEMLQIENKIFLTPEHLTVNQATYQMADQRRGSSWRRRGRRAG